MYIIIIKYLSQISTHVGVHALVCMCMRDREAGRERVYNSHLIYSDSTCKSLALI